MTRDEGIRALGLSAESTPFEIVSAYRLHSSPLKRRILATNRPDHRDQYRRHLLTWVRIRDAALGHARSSAGASRPAGLALHDLLLRIASHPINELDRDRALRFFGMTSADARDQLREVCEQDRRILVRAFTLAQSREEMLDMRRAINKLRTIRNFALA